MGTLSAEALTAMSALIGIVIIVSARGLAGRLLCVTQRKYQRSYGATASAEGMASRPCTHRRMGSAAEGRSADRKRDMSTDEASYGFPSRKAQEQIPGLDPVQFE